MYLIQLNRRLLKVLKQANTQDSLYQVEDFYTWSRDYWIELGCNDDNVSSGMLNFGLWEEHTNNMFNAQENLCNLIILCLGKPPVNTRGLEIGCGNGGVAIRLAKECNVTLTCMDLVSSQLEIGLKLAESVKLEKQIEFCQGNSMNMPFKTGIFDFSYCIESSFHYPDKLAFFRENFRVLKPQTTAVIADITCENNSLVTFRKGNYFCSLEETQQLLCEAGFTVDRIIRIGERVFHPLQNYVKRFNADRRNKLYRYWTLVLKNYADLFDLNVMGYDIFILSRDN